MHDVALHSHNLAATRAFDDFDVNASGKVNFLEACRSQCPVAVFIHLSTNKVYVYGDAPNQLKWIETKTRFDFVDSHYVYGNDKNFTIDQSKYSLFGASKLVANIYIWEYRDNLICLFVYLEGLLYRT